MAEQNTISEQVKQVLTANQEQIALESIQSEDSSPLNQPVIEKDIGGKRPINDKDKDEPWNVWKPETDADASDMESNAETTDYPKEAAQTIEQEKLKEPLDAPEQEINSEDAYEQDGETVTDKDFEIPLAQANQTATALLGITNNVLTAGGSYFVKLKKHEEFYQFNEIVDVIDAQNEKNVGRILLDKEDKALLRPLLAEVIRKKAKKLTPEQQLFGAIASIILKKGQVVMEIRAENLELENRLLSIIKEQKQETDHTEASLSETQDYKNDFEQESEQEQNEFVDDQQEIESEASENSIIEYAVETKK